MEGESESEKEREMGEEDGEVMWLLTFATEKELEAMDKQLVSVCVCVMAMKELCGGAKVVGRRDGRAGEVPK